MATKAQVRNKALKKLRALEEGETPSNETIADVEGAYDELHAYLFEKNAVYWDSDEDIPTDAVKHVVAMIAANMADDFNVDEIRYQRLQVEGSNALDSLIELATPEHISRPITAEFF